MTKTIKDILTNLACESFNRGALNDDSRVDESVDKALFEIEALIDGAKIKKITIPCETGKMFEYEKGYVIGGNAVIDKYQDNLRKVIK